MRILMSVVALLAGLSLYGYTSGDTYQYVTAAMEIISASPEWEDCIEDDSTNTIPILFPTMESLFLYEMPSNSCGCGWTASEKQQAFDEYLMSLGATNQIVFTDQEISLGERVLLCCQEKGYTNAIAAVTRILKNPRSPYFKCAMRLLLDMQQPTYDMNLIILSIVTNRSLMTCYDRCMAMSSYVAKLTEAKNSSVKADAVNIFFSKRELIEDHISVDRLMLSADTDYIGSSNRFLFANEVLSLIKISEKERVYFSLITNSINHIGATAGGGE